MQLLQSPLGGFGKATPAIPSSYESEGSFQFLRMDGSVVTHMVRNLFLEFGQSIGFSRMEQW